MSVYNTLEGFFIEGFYEVTEDALVREMTVSYPDGYAHSADPKIPGRQRVYRSTRRLGAPDRLEHETYMRIGGEWRRWPTEGLPPMIL